MCQTDLQLFCYSQISYVGVSVTLAWQNCHKFLLLELINSLLSPDFQNLLQFLALGESDNFLDRDLPIGNIQSVGKIRLAHWTYFFSCKTARKVHFQFFLQIHYLFKVQIFIEFIEINVIDRWSYIDCKEIWNRPKSSLPCSFNRRLMTLVLSRSGKVRRRAFLTELTDVLRDR